MGWIAASGCTVIAVYAAYRLVLKNGNSEPEKYGSDGDGFSLEQKSVSTPETSTPIVEKDAVGISQPHSPPSFNFISPNNEVNTTGLLKREQEPSVLVSAENDIPIITMPPPPTFATPSSPPRLKPPTFSAMPAPSRPANGSIRPPPSAAASLRVPQTKVLPNTSMAPSSLGLPKKQASKQVTLKPGYSPLDWAALTSNPKSNLRGKDAPDHLIRVTPSRLKQQNGRKGKDAWTVYQGKVYNITSYLPFHPGGEGELMRGAGRDAAKLFMEVHPWVNWDGMLSECLVGILVGEEDTTTKQNNSGGLDDMD